MGVESLLPLVAVVRFGALVSGLAGFGFTATAGVMSTMKVFPCTQQ